MALNKKGQASLTDAMYFLIVISGLSTLMFVYTADYGIQISNQLDKQYKAEYATSALKTILNSSVSRDNNPNFKDSEEVDYLLALLKEDYGVDGKLEKETKKIIAKKIQSVMLPLQPTFDYVFYIYDNDVSEFVLIVLFGGEHVGLQSKSVLNSNLGNGLTKRSLRLCTAKVHSDIESDFLTKIGSVSRAPLLSIVLPSVSDSSNVVAFSSLIMWPATNTIGVINSVNSMDCDCVFDVKTGKFSGSSC